jgi:RNA polymerase sigma factor for flagellar operon FliA
MITAYQQQHQSWSVAEREQLVLDHMPQVRLIASRIHAHLPKHVPLEDLISAGVVGLLAAVDNFDPDRGVKLKTFAEHKIRGYVLNSIGKFDGTSRARNSNQKRVRKAIADATVRLNATPQSDDIAEEMGLTLDEYYAMLSELQFVTLGGLDAIADEDGSSMVRGIADSNSEAPDRTLERRELQMLVLQAIKEIPQAERIVLNMYYVDELNLREIASIMDLHMTRISQIKTQAVLRLRAKFAQLWPGRFDA